MKIILASVGTRGDMEPFLAIGELLKEKGHHVICAFPEQFRYLADNSQLEFASLGAKFIELLDSDVGKAAMGGSSGLKKFRALIKLAKTQKESQKELIQNQHDIIEQGNPDRILYNSKAVYPILWELKNKGKTIYVSPLPFIHYVKGHTHIAFNGNYGEWLNKLSFALAHFGIQTTIKMSKKWLEIKEKSDSKQIRNILKNNKSIYTISPSLFPRPDYWSNNLKVLGYFEKKNTNNWQPDKSLTDFLERHDKILFVTFGSMINPEPEKKTNIILDILGKNKIPAIINTASGGLVQPASFNSELVYFVKQIPYHWVFPKVYGVIHHGGSGTTHLTLKYGCASMIIPHIIDQFVWNTIISNLGVGPKGVKIGKISLKSLEPKILDLLTNESYKQKAKQIKSQMVNENFEGELYEMIINKKTLTDNFEVN